MCAETVGNTLADLLLGNGIGWDAFFFDKAFDLLGDSSVRLLSYCTGV